MSSRGDHGGTSMDDISSKKRKHVTDHGLDINGDSNSSGGNEESVSVKLDTGEFVSLCISKERVDAFRELRQAQRVRFAKFFKQLTDDLQCGKELPTEHELYQYLAATELQRLRDLASLLAKDKSKPPPPPPPRPHKPEFEQAVAILSAAHPCHIRNWPSGTLYSARVLSEYEVRSAAMTPQSWLPQQSLEPLIEIRMLPDFTHPAFPGYGVFASQPIAAGTEIGLYTGILRKRQQTNDSESLYIAALTRETDIDAELVGNEVRFINDYRNTGKEPNIKYERAQRGARLVLIVRTTRAVAQDEELLVDYGDEYWRQLQKNKRRRALREANQYSDNDTDDSSDEVVTLPPPSRRPTSGRSSTHSEVDSSALRQWHAALEEVQMKGNRAIDWLVKEEIPEVLATGRRRFSVPAHLVDEAEVFTRLNWLRYDKTSWRIPDDLEVTALARAYDESQRAAQRARSTRVPAASAPLRKRPAVPQHQHHPVGDEGATMTTGYPELLGLLQLAQLRDNSTITAEEFTMYKAYLTRTFVARFT